MQPYFLPYLGHFNLINAVDKWIVFDEVQFIKHGWIERNRVLNSKNEWSYIKVPLKKYNRDTLIKNIQINSVENWKNKILAQLTSYKKKAPYYKQVIDFLNEAFEYDSNSIVQLNSHLLNKTCDYLGITFDYQILSEMNLKIDPIEGPGDWALNISKALNADIYINPVDGREIFDKEKFIKHNIKLKFIKPVLSDYVQRIGRFEKGLSIIDVMMFNDKESLKQIINEYEIIE